MAAEATTVTRRYGSTETRIWSSRCCTTSASRVLVTPACGAFGWAPLRRTVRHSFMGCETVVLNSACPSVRRMPSLIGAAPPGHWA